MKRKIFALLAALICSISSIALTSCKKSDSSIPMGFQLASNPDVPDYRILLPDEWTVETSTGTTSAYLKDKITNKVLATFTASFSAPSDNEVTLENYFEGFMKEFEEAFGPADNLKINDTLLGGEKAKQYLYNASFGGQEYSFWQVVTFHKNRIYTLTYSSAADLYEKYAEDMAVTLEYFSFTK